MKHLYIPPATTLHPLHLASSLLSASISPDGKSTSWADAEDDTEGLDIQVKGSIDTSWEDVW